MIESHATTTAPDAPRSAKSALWAALQNAGKHLLGLVIFMLMARLLEPAAYGMIALAGLVVTLVGALVEQGFNDALVQRAEIETGHLNAAFWLMLASALLLAAALLVGAPLFAAMLGQRDLGPVLRSLAVLFPIQALAVVPQALLQRAFAFRILALRTLAAQAIGGVVGVALAVRGEGVWSLVAQQVTVGLVGCVVLWTSCHWRPGLAFSWRHARELYRFGRHILGFNVLDLLKRKSDDLIVGVFLGPAALGAYSLAYQILLMLEQLMCKGFDAVALVAFSRLRGDAIRMRQAYCTSARLSALVAFPTFVGAALVMPELVEGVLGDHWRAAVPVMQILMLVGALHAVFHYNHAVFKACGKPYLSLRLGLVEAAANVALFLVAVRWGIEAVAVAYVAVAYAMAPWSLRAVHRLLALDMRSYLRQLLVPLAASLAMAACVIAVRALASEHYGARVTLVLLVVTGVVAYAASIRATAPAAVAQLLAQIRLARSPAARGAR